MASENRGLREQLRRGHYQREWSESFAAYFAQRAGWTFSNNDKNAGKAPGEPLELIGAAAIPNKIDLIDEWVQSL